MWQVLFRANIHYSIWKTFEGITKITKRYVSFPWKWQLINKFFASKCQTNVESKWIVYARVYTGEGTVIYNPPKNKHFLDQSNSLIDLVYCKGARKGRFSHVFSKCSILHSNRLLSLINKTTITYVVLTAYYMYIYCIK